MMRRIDITGQTFGALTALSMIYEPGKDSRAHCACVCGNTVTAIAYNLRSGNTSSCGCLARKTARETGKRNGAIQGKKNATHGMSKTPTYAKWLDARKRCFREKDAHFADYGGRGITMCREWAESFEAFLADMGVAPEGMTLERNDVDGSYEPNNCRWASKLEQARNKRRVKASMEIARAIRAKPQSSTRELAAELGLSEGVVWHIRNGTTWKEPA